MMDLRSAEVRETRETRETAKILLESIDCVQKETLNELRMIADAVYRGNSPCETGCAQDEPRAEPIIIMLARQRKTAQDILDALIQIREALW